MAKFSLDPVYKVELLGNVSVEAKLLVQPCETYRVKQPHSETEEVVRPTKF